MIKQIFTYDEPFELETGNRFSAFKLAYHTYGNLSAKKDNVIWVCHALTANSEVADWWGGIFGSGKILDPDLYYIICANNIASPYGSISPNELNPETGERFGIDFPLFTIRDNARCFILLKESLGIEDIHLMIGGSCGGNIALEMSIILQEQIKNMVLLCSSALERPWTIAIHETQRVAMENNADFSTNEENAGKVALQIARSIATPFYRTANSFNTQQKEDDSTKFDNYKASSYIKYQGKKLVDRFNAHCYYILLNALDTHHVGRNRVSVEAALESVKAKTLCIGMETDLFIPTREQKFLAKYIPDSHYEEVISIYGHDAFLIEFEQITQLVNKYIDI